MGDGSYNSGSCEGGRERGGERGRGNWICHQRVTGISVRMQERIDNA